MTKMQRYCLNVINQQPLHQESDYVVELAFRGLLTEKLKENPNCSLVFKNGKFVVIEAGKIVYGLEEGKE